MAHTSFSVHNIAHIEATSGGTTGAPLCLLLRDKDYNYHAVTLFTENLPLTEALAAAITTAVATHPNPPAAEPATVRYRLTPADYRD